MKNTVLLFTCLYFALCSNVFAQIEGYQSSDNTGLNKKERIDTVEKYLMDLSGSLKKMEAKLDENAKKIMALEGAVKKINEKTQVQLNGQLGEKRPDANGDLSQIDKMKADILSLKNKDIEKLKIDLSELTDTVKALQSTVKSQL